ncbi:MAG: SCP2 sterol-binding domain-containing protein [Clostridia bacterium]
MPTSSLKQEIRALYQKADHAPSLSSLLSEICDTLRKHPDELKGITYSYRICASDSGYVKAFALEDGLYSDSTEMNEADVIVTGKEVDLLAILQQKLSPMSAILRGKVNLN